MGFSKRIRALREKLTPGHVYSIDEAVTILKEADQNIKFDESVDAAVRLGVDPRKSDQAVRGATVLPHGTGKTVRVAVFAEGKAADEASAAGADIVGLDELAADVKAGKMDFDVVVAAPDAMRVVGQLGQILGPRGLMPNPKVGTVTPDVATAVKNAKGGQIRYRTDKNGIIHSTVGKISFGVKEIKENLESLLKDLKKAKPANAKGVYMVKVTLSTTMGPGLTIDMGSIDI